MHSTLQQNLFLIKEHVGFFKAANNYDVYDPATGEIILNCREPKLGKVTKLFRLSKYRRMTPFDIHVTATDGTPVLFVQRSSAFLLSKVNVLDEDGDRIGGFKEKMFSLGGQFQVVGEDDEELCRLKGKWTGWEFKFVHDGRELATVSKKWSGLGKEFFTSADNYVLQISDEVPPTNPIRMLIVAAVFCIDMVLKE